MSRVSPITVVGLSILSILSVPLSASAVTGAPVTGAHERDFRRDFAVGDALEVEVELPVGDLDVEPADGDRIDAEIEVDCSGWFADCDDVDGVDLVSRRRGDTLVLEVSGVDDGMDGIEIDLELRVPSRLAVDVEMGVGEIEIGEMARDIRVHLGVGDARIEAREETVASVDLRVGVGDASLRPASGRSIDGSGFISRKLRWNDGPGDARISVEVGVGDADVTLR